MKLIGEPAHTLDLQTTTTVGKVSVTDDSTALLLDLLGFSATKLWNAALWHSKETWKTTGKMPSYEKMDRAVKQDHPVWYRRLHSQGAQAILEEPWRSYRSWFSLRKKGDTKANPPGFRRRTSLSAVTFKQSAVRWNPQTSTARFNIPKDIYGKQFLYLKVSLPEGVRLDESTIQLARLVHHDCGWSAHFVYSTAIPELNGAGETMAIDLGITHLAATA